MDTPWGLSPPRQMPKSPRNASAPALLPAAAPASLLTLCKWNHGVQLGKGLAFLIERNCSEIGLYCSVSVIHLLSRRLVGLRLCPRFAVGGHGAVSSHRYCEERPLDRLCGRVWRPLKVAV